MTDDRNHDNATPQSGFSEEEPAVRVTMRPAPRQRAEQRTGEQTTPPREGRARRPGSVQTPQAPEPAPAPPANAPEEAAPNKPRRSRGGRGRGRGKATAATEEPILAPISAPEPPPIEPQPVAETPAEQAPQGEKKTRRGRRGRGGGSKAAIEEKPVEQAPPAPTTPVEIPAPEPAPEPKRGRGRGASREKPAVAEAPPPPRARGRSRAAVEEVTATKEIIVNVEPRETRIAVIEGQKLMELHIEREERVVGSIFKGRVSNVLPGMDAAFVDVGLERNAFLYVGDVLPEAAELIPSSRRRDTRNLNIKEMLKPNQEIMVQIVKAPRGTKGARVSTRVSLPGRYIVLMPESDSMGISRKVDDPAERDRLKRIGDKIRPKGFGVIIRTEAEGKGEQDLTQDVELTLNLWQQIQEKAAVTPAPGLVHQDLSIIFKTIRDVFSEDVSKLIIDSPADYEKACELVHYISPELESRLILYEDPEPIFERYSIETEIERLLRPKVWLKSGGYLSIDQTEALTTIDVNTGKFIGSTSLSETILRTNLDAVTEVCRQFRLRDIGGIIIIDFIDMSSLKDRSQVMQALEKSLKDDRTRTKIAHLSPLGLVEMTRKRTAETVTEILTNPCPYCAGRGRVSSADTVSIQIERELRKQCVVCDDEAFLIWAHPDVTAQLVGPGGDVVERLEQELHRAIFVRADSTLHIETHRILPGDLQELNRQMLTYRGGQVVEAIVDGSSLFSPPRAAAWVDGYLIDVVNGGEHAGERVKVKLSQVYRSYAFGEVIKPAKVLDKSEPI